MWKEEKEEVINYSKSRTKTLQTNHSNGIKKIICCEENVLKGGVTTTGNNV